MKKKRINKLIHKWLSIPLGLIIFVICLSGAALVFQQEILELSNPSHYFVDEVKEEVIPLDQLVSQVNAKLEDNTVASVKITNHPQRTYTIGLTEGFRSSVFVNQYTGEITGKYAVKESPFFTIMSIHRWLLDSTRTWGKYIVGWSTILFIVILVTGFFYIPKRLKKNYKIQLNTGSQRLMHGLHNTLGTYSILILIICSLSGLMWSFDWFRNGVFSIFGAEELPAQGEKVREKKEKSETNTLHWQSAVNNILQEKSDYDYVKISDGLIDAHPKNTYRTRVQDKYSFDKNSGEIIKFTPFANQDVRSKVWAWAYSLHVGDYWGIWSKIFTFIFCLVGASLPITGYYFTIKKWNQKRVRKKKQILN